MSTPDSPGAPAPSPVVLGGRYEVHKRLARGGMAEVFLARDQALDRPVAVKILFPEFAADPAFVERFRREAQAAANLSHPNIVSVYDWGTESGTYYIVMEYVEGQSLAEVIRDSGPLQPRRAAEIVFEVAGALGFAHQRGVVHRDVKPGNVLLSTTGVCKVTDFGIARALSSPADDLTQAGSVMGTATYFSPEQAQGFAVDARSDLYSLGVVLYEVLCGRAPFVGDTPVAIAYQHVQEWPPRPSQFVTGVPLGLESVILKLLAKKPEQRYLSADDLRADLRRFLDGQTTLAEEELARPGGGAGAAAAGAVAGAAAAGAATTVHRATPAATTAVPPTPPPAPAAPPTADDDDELEEPPTRTGLFVALVAVLLVGLGLLGFWLVRSLDDDGTSGEEVLVASVRGMTRDDAVAELERQGFNPVVREEASEVEPEGLVFRQSPKENTPLEKGRDVVIWVSTGPSEVEVPSVADMNEEMATKTLTDAGFSVRREEVESELFPGIAVETVPAAGEMAPNASEVVLRISSGPGTVEVPNVQGKTVEEASRILVDNGFVVGSTSEEPNSLIEEGLVTRTDPVGSVAKNATIRLFVSSGAQKVRVPTVVGSTVDEARSRLIDANLGVTVENRSLPAGDPNDGRVVDVDPATGTSVDAGSTVRITVGRATAATTTTSAGGVTTTAP